MTIEPGCTVGFLETYHNSARVLLQRRVWGKVSEIKTLGGGEHFAYYDEYARVERQDGEFSWIATSRLMLHP